MKKRLFAIALTLMLALTLLPTAAYATDEGGTSPETMTVWCTTCRENTTFDNLKFIKDPNRKYNPEFHYVSARCMKCKEIKAFLPDIPSVRHSGGTETPTCTTGKTCEKCGETYGILGHDWSAGTSNNDGKTHTRTCQREGCGAVDTANCGGDSGATCVKLGTCTSCGQQYYGEHYFAKPYTYGYNENSHWHVCSYCEEGREAVGEHRFVQGISDSCLKSEATCISRAVYYENCSTCHYKGTNTYPHPWGPLDPKNHDGGGEIKDAKAVTCTEKGYTGDTYCKGCGVKLTDGTDIPATGHDLKHVPDKRATVRAEGNIEYWYCEDCGKYYADADAAKEITQADTVIPKRRPSGTTPYDPDVYKELMDGKDTQSSVSSPKTGDAGIALYVGMAVLSLTGTALYGKKRMK